MILAIFDLQVTPDTSYQVLTQLAFYSEEVQNSFSRWQLWQPSCISDRNDFRYFYLQVTSFTKFKSFGLSVQEKQRKIDLQDGRHGSHLGFPIGTILAIFDLPVIPELLTKLFLIYKKKNESFLSRLGSTGLSVQEKRSEQDLSPDRIVRLIWHILFLEDS